MAGSRHEQGHSAEKHPMLSVVLLLIQNLQTVWAWSRWKYATSKWWKWKYSFCGDFVIDTNSQRTVWGKIQGPGPQGKEGVNYRWRSLPHLMSISSVSASNFTPLWVVVDKWMKIHHRGLHTYRGWQSQSHPLLLKLRARKHLIWFAKHKHSFMSLCCSWSFQLTDFDRRPWWERSIAFSRSKRNGIQQYRENWDVCLSLSKRIHSLASAWRKDVSIHQALKEAGAFFRVAWKGEDIAFCEKKKVFSWNSLSVRLVSLTGN